MKAHELNIDSVALAELKALMNSELQRVVRQMEKKGLYEGAVGVKIKIGMMETVDEAGEIHHTVVFEPKVTARYGSSGEEKCGATGGRVTVDGEGNVILGQISMDELTNQKGA